ncbi:general transcription factor II-I repeat domain-containing protein 2-like, partial [Aphis craccivora]
KSLDISINHTSFEHPKINARIHVFADVPHLLKLARNHLLVSGFILPNGKFIGKNILQELLNINHGKDYKFAHKLSERHLFVDGSSRMNVRLAANVFSNSVSKAIAYCGEKHYLDKYNRKEASEIIQLFNDWFDIFNTQHKFDKVYRQIIATILSR